MCLILFSINNHSKYKLVVAANRDEFYARPTAPADYWKDYSHILAGRDLQANGTWLGVNKYGKLAMLTNYRDLLNINPNAKSRGELVAGFLRDKNIDQNQYLNIINKEDHLYNGYNLIFGSAEELCHYSNVSGKSTFIEKGIHGLSNHLLDSDWPKVKRGKEKLTHVLLNLEIEAEQVFEALYDDIKAPDNQLPNTGVGLDLERMLSSMFIKSPDYGSRCSTVILVDNHDNWTFHERTYNIQDFTYSTASFQFKADSK